MKKAAVYSFFESYNIGDILISQQVKSLFGEENYDYFNIGDGKAAKDCMGLVTSLPKNSSSVKSKILKIGVIKALVSTLLCLKSQRHKAIFNASKGYDTVIFAGGNQIMELNPLPSSIITLYRAVKLMKKANKKICFCFSGIGPFRSKISKIYAKRILRAASFISVRDSYSAGKVRELLKDTEISLWCDPVLLKEMEPKAGGQAIGVNVYFGHEKDKQALMEDAYVKVITEIRQKTDAQIMLFSSELTDIKDILSLKAHFKEDSGVLVKEIKNADELFEFYGTLSGVLGARMHTLITATISGVPTVSIAWQGKVQGLMELLCCGELNFGVAAFLSDPITVATTLMDTIKDTKKAEEKKHALKKQREETTLKIKEFLLGMEA